MLSNIIIIMVYFKQHIIEHFYQDITFIMYPNREKACQVEECADQAALVVTVRCCKYILGEQITMLTLGDSKLYADSGLK